MRYFVLTILIYILISYLYIFNYVPLKCLMNCRSFVNITRGPEEWDIETGNWKTLSSVHSEEGKDMIM